jgi:hypothetical protein
MRRYAIQAVVLATSIVAFGCEGNGGNSGATSSAPAATAQAVATPAAVPAANPHKFRHHAGLAASVFRAAHDLDLPAAAQESLNTLETNLKADDENVRAAMKAFRADLVSGVKAGKLDSAKLGEDNGVVDQAIGDHKAKEAEALNSLHGQLDAPQRAALLASVRSKQAEREAHMMDWMTAKEANGAPPDWTKKRLDKLTADLALDTSQQSQVAGILGKLNDPPNAAGLQARWAERKARVDALLTAFASDTFDAKQLDLSILPGKTAHEPMQHMVGFATQVLPVLHPDQRDKFAASLDRPFGWAGHGSPEARGPADDIAFPFNEPVDSPIEGQSATPR